MFNFACINFPESLLSIGFTYLNGNNFREIKSSRKVWGSPIRENKYPRKTENNRFANTSTRKISIWLIREI